MADITQKDTVVKGVNSPNNYVRSEAHIIDGTENPDILATGTHSLFELPSGVAVTGIKAIALDDAAAGTGGSIQFKVGDTLVGTAVAVADFVSGSVESVSVSGVTYDEDAQTVKLTVGTAALTAVKILVVVEYLPVVEFITAG